MEQLLEQGSIVLVPFPFTDLSSQKLRPALVVSPNWFNERYEDVVLLAMTSVIPDELGNQISIAVVISNEDLTKGSIPSKSIVKITKFFTCSQDLIAKRVAEIRKIKLSETLEKLRHFFDE